MEMGWCTSKRLLHLGYDFGRILHLGYYLSCCLPAVSLLSPCCLPAVSLLFPSISLISSTVQSYSRMDQLQ